MYSRTICIGGIPYKMQRNNNQSKPNSRKGKGKQSGALVSAPVAMNRSSRQSGRQSIRYRECERVATVVGSVAFGIVNNVPCNPAISTSFPWLSGHAQLYERYKVHKLVYRYKNLKGTSTDGNILMSFDYDTLDAAPTSAVQMTQQTHWIDGAPWRIFELSVPPTRGDLFTRAGAIASSDLKTYDFGRLFIAAEGCADTSDHGYLEVEYDIELFEKQSQSSGSSSSQNSMAMFNLGSNASASSSTITIPYDETVVNPFSITNSSGTFTLPAGNWLVTAESAVTFGSLNAVAIEKDGAALTPPILTTNDSGYGRSAVCSAYVTSDGTNTCRVRLNGGNLAAALADNCRVIFRLL